MNAHLHFRLSVIFGNFCGESFFFRYRKTLAEDRDAAAARACSTGCECPPDFVSCFRGLKFGYQVISAQAVKLRGERVSACALDGQTLLAALFLRTLVYLVIYDSGRACLLHRERVSACEKATRILISCSRFRVSKFGFRVPGGKSSMTARVREKNQKTTWTDFRFRVSVFVFQIRGSGTWSEQLDDGKRARKKSTDKVDGS